MASCTGSSCPKTTTPKVTTAKACVGSSCPKTTTAPKVVTTTAKACVGSSCPKTTTPKVTTTTAKACVGSSCPKTTTAPKACVGSSCPKPTTTTAAKSCTGSSCPKTTTTAPKVTTTSSCVGGNCPTTVAATTVKPAVVTSGVKPSMATDPMYSLESSIRNSLFGPGSFSTSNVNQNTIKANIDKAVALSATTSNKTANSDLVAAQKSMASALGIKGNTSADIANRNAQLNATQASLAHAQQTVNALGYTRGKKITL